MFISALLKWPSVENSGRQLLSVRVCVLLFRGRGIGVTGHTGSKKVLIVQQEEEPSRAAPYSAKFRAGWEGVLYTHTHTHKLKNTLVECDNSFL